MKKIFISLFCIFSSILFASNTIELTGEYSQELGNPFRALLEKKSKTINVYSENKYVELKVESNLDNNSIYNIHLQHPKKYILKNKTIENIMEDYYGEEYKVVQKKGNIEINILSGKIFISYENTENTQINNISKITVELNIKILKNNMHTLQLIKMDDTLEINGDNYNWTIRSTFNFKHKDINSKIQQIIEHIVYRKILK